MTALLILGILLLFFIFLLSLKARITICYRDELTLSVKVLFIKIGILPKKEKVGPHSMSAKKAKKIREAAAKKEKKKREAALEKKAKKAQKKENKKNAPKKSISEIMDMISLIRKLVAIVIRRFFKHLRIDIARLRITVATGDAATTAIAYGAITQSINLLLPVLERVKNFGLPRTTELDIQPDFTAEAPDVDIVISFSLRVWHLFHVAFGALKTLIKHLVNGKMKKSASPSDSHAFSKASANTKSKNDTQAS